ncbi:MAG: zinc ribbon domain-containing protein [Chloroflexi bacterium]|nr:MAG: zinc ribbon domain-containing protein [Chloroflexota bacterium]
MPLYEYYCEACDKVFEALRSVAQSEEPALCPRCGAEADRIMPTTFASMSRKEGWRQRVPFHHKPVRAGAPAKTIARVKPKEMVDRKGKAEGTKS